MKRAETNRYLPDTTVDSVTVHLKRKAKIMAIIASGIMTVVTDSFHASASHTVKPEKINITILQTADIHGQLDSHPELFRENGKIVFKERGGFAHLKTLFEDERRKNPGRTVIVDAGDMIQGSGYAALSEGTVFPEIVKHML